MTTDREMLEAAANEAGCAHASLLYDIAEKIEELRTLAFAAGAASRDVEIAELVVALERLLWYIDNYGEKMRHDEHQRFRNGKFDTDASSAAVEFNEVMDAEIDSAKEVLAKVRKPT